MKKKKIARALALMMVAENSQKNNTYNSFNPTALAWGK
jgi:hypothetical protein